MSFRSFSVQGATIRGVDAVPVSVEVVISNGLPGFAIVGMADAATKSQGNGLRPALRSSGFVMPNEKIVVNLAPGALRKTGSGFDLPSLSVFWRNGANRSRGGAPCLGGWRAFLGRRCALLGRHVGVSTLCSGARARTDSRVSR